MPGFDGANQRSGGMPGIRRDVGLFEFSSGSATADVPTTLARAMCGLAIADLTATTDPQQTLQAYKVGDVSNGTVTFVRAGGSINEDARMSYLLEGY